MLSSLPAHCRDRPPTVVSTRPARVPACRRAPASPRRRSIRNVAVRSPPVHRAPAASRASTRGSSPACDSGRCRRARRADEGFVDQRSEQVQDVLRRKRLGAANDFRSSQIEAADEHPESCEQRLLPRCQQVVGPVDQRPQRLLALLQHAGTAGQDLVAVLQPIVDLGDGQRAHARRGQLERERNAFESRDQFRDRGACATSSVNVGLFCRARSHESCTAGEAAS